MNDVGIVALTLGIASLATLVIVVPGVVCASFLARHRGPLRTFVETMVSLPLVLPPTAVGLVLLQLLRPGGPVGRVLATFGVELLFSWPGAVIASSVMSFPLLVRSARTAFEEIDPRLIDVARTLGATRVQAFVRVALPLASRGIVAGALLAFARAVGEFGATILVAGNIEGETQTLALAIFTRTQIGDDRGALRLVAYTVVIAFLAIAATELLTRRRARASGAS